MEKQFFPSNRSVIVPRFYFSLADGSYDQDTEGTDLPDAAAARIAAIRFIGELLHHEPDRLSQEHPKLVVEVTDHSSTPLFILEIRFKDLTLAKSR